VKLLQVTFCGDVLKTETRCYEQEHQEQNEHEKHHSKFTNRFLACLVIEFFQKMFTDLQTKTILIDSAASRLWKRIS